MRWFRTQVGRLVLGSVVVVVFGGAAILFFSTRHARGAQLYERAQGLAAAGMVNEAVDTYLAAIRSDPRFAPPYRALALMASTRGYYNVAVDYWRKYLERAPRAPHVLCQLAYCEEKFGTEVPALEDAEAELRRDPHCRLAHLAAGLLYTRKAD